MNESFEIVSPHHQKAGLDSFSLFWNCRKKQQTIKKKTADAVCAICISKNELDDVLIECVRSSLSLGNWFQDESFERGAKTIASQQPHIHYTHWLNCQWLNFDFGHSFYILYVHHRHSSRIWLKKEFRCIDGFDCPHAKPNNIFIDLEKLE